MRGEPSVINRRGVVGLVLMSTLLAACGTTGVDDADLFLRFRANGSLVEFTDQTSLLGVFGQAEGESFLLVGGFTATSNAGIQIYDDRPITTGTYTGYSVGGEVAGVIITYLTPEGVLYAVDPQASEDATATITQITAARVQGTFSATLSASGEADLAITDGEFLVLRTG